MTAERKDEVNGLYEGASMVSDIASVLFWSNVTCTILTLFDFGRVIGNSLNIASIVLTISYTVLIFCHDNIFFRRAENERRKVLISDSLGIKSSTRKTVHYYNNNESQSIMRLGVNSYESVFFYKKDRKKNAP